MPYLTKQPGPCKCKLPAITDKLGKSMATGTEWYCAKCLKIYKLSENRHGLYWHPTGKRYGDKVESNPYTW